RRAARDDDLLGRARAPSEAPPRARRVGDRLAPLLRPPHGRDRREARAEGAGLPAAGEAERDLPPSGVRDLRGGAARPRAAPAPRPRHLHVGLGLPAPRQHVPALARGDRARLPGPRARLRRAGDGDQLRAAVRVRLATTESWRPAPNGARTSRSASGPGPYRGR